MKQRMPIKLKTYVNRYRMDKELLSKHPENKDLLEKRKDELPHMTKIFPTPYLEDDMVYLITDEELKKSMLECMEIRKGEIRYGRNQGINTTRVF